MSRARARQLAHAAVSRGEPLAWFEELYSQAESAGLSSIPWADLEPNPNLVEWLDRRQTDRQGKRALKVGCGLGDDAEELSRRGFDVVAFDISKSAVAMSKRRFPQSSVRYEPVDLFHPPDWVGRFDLVLESYTLQVLPPALRLEAMTRITSFVAPGGNLLLITRARENEGDPGQMPWPLTRSELGHLQECGLKENGFEDYIDDEEPPVRRFRAEYHKPSDSRIQDAPSDTSGKS